jgi:hypothetical protein
MILDKLESGGGLSADMRGHSASQTRVNALLTRASIFLRKGQ